jgi:DNA topoisomerase-3
MTKLIIAEKPSMAKKYREALKGTPDLVVTNSVGHIETLADLEHYLADKMKGKGGWSDSVALLPFIPARFVHVVKEAEVFDEIARQLPKATEIILACDPDREGELIHRNIIEIADLKGLVKTTRISRVWLHSETAAEIKKAFDGRKSAAAYEGYYQAARTREAVDWLVGIQLTRLYSVKYSHPGKVLSIGRVQSWLLSEIAKRYRENKEHRSTPFWTFQFLTGEGVPFNLVDNDGKILQYPDPNAAEQTFAALRGEPLAIRAVTVKKATEHAPALYDLKQLQKDAATKLKLSPDETLKIAQALYEEHELISYPRTDCNVLSAEEAAEIPKAVALVEKFPEYRELVGAVRAVNPALGLAKKYIGNLQGHYAIIPVLSYSKDRAPDLDVKEMGLFDLIVKRFLAALLPPAQAEQTEIFATIKDARFVARFKNYIDRGYLKHIAPVKDEDEKDEDIRSGIAYRNGQIVAGRLVKNEDKTKPQPLFKDTSILTLMERAHLLVKDKSLRDALKEANGIGTAATRASFVPTLISRGYIEKEKGSYIPTQLGLDLDKILPEELKVPDFSARLEHNLWAIVQGAGSAGFGDIIRDTEAFLRRVFERVGHTAANLDVDAQDALGDCPKCRKGHVMVKEKGYFCNDRECGFALWKSIAGATLTKTEAKNLLKTGETKKALKMESAKGKDFEARLKLNRETWKLDFVFDDKRPPATKKDPARSAPATTGPATGGNPLSEKQLAVIERNASDAVKKAVAKGDYAAGRKFLDEFFKKK